MSLIDNQPDDLAQFLPIGLDKNQEIAALLRSEQVSQYLAQVLLRGGGLMDLAQKTAELMLSDLAFVSTDGRILAECGFAGDYPEELFDPSGRFYVERFVPGLSQNQKLIIVGIPSGGSHELGKLVARTDQSFEPGDVLIFERVSTAAGLALTKLAAVSAIESKYQGDFLREVLDGRAGAAEQVKSYARSLSWDFERSPLYVIASRFEFSEEPSTEKFRLALERFTNAWQSVVRPTDSSAAIVAFTQEVVVVIHSQNATAKDLLHQLCADVVGDGGGGRHAFNAGISAPVLDVEGLPEGYLQATQALVVGRKLYGLSSRADFESLGVYRLLSQVPDTTNLTKFLSETLGELAIRDDEEASDLLQTLDVLLDQNLNVAEASRILHFHYNTLRYRILKLEKILGPFTVEPQTRLAVELALKIKNMRGL